MTLPRVIAMMGAWTTLPPISWSLSALAGFKPAEKMTDANGEQDLRGMFGIVVEEKKRGE